jgi:hypothetical protein
MADKVARKLWRRLPAVHLVDSPIVIPIAAILNILRSRAGLRSSISRSRNDLFRRLPARARGDTRPIRHVEEDEMGHATRFWTGGPDRSIRQRTDPFPQEPAPA